MKVALCLSGHLRTFRNTAKSLKDNIIDPLNCDVFIHTWDVLGSPTGKNPGDVNNQDTQIIDIMPEIYDLLNPTLISIERQKDKLEELKFKTRDIIIPIDEKQFIMQHIGLHISMFYSLYMSNNIRKEYEEENQIKYDMIIRCRPDIFLKTKLNLSMFPDKNKIYVPEIATYVENGINDQMAIGYADVMEYYFNIYNDVENYYRYHYSTVRPEVIIKYYLNKYNIITEEKPINYDIYRLDGGILRQYKMYAEMVPNSNFYTHR